MPFLSALVERTVSVTFFLPVLLADAVLWPCRRIVPLSFAVVFADTAQLIDLRFAASLHAAANASAGLRGGDRSRGAAAGAASRSRGGPDAGAPGCR